MSFLYEIYRILPFRYKIVTLYYYVLLALILLKKLDFGEIWAFLMIVSLVFSKYSWKRKYLNNEYGRELFEAFIILKLPIDASDFQIKNAYRHFCVKHHPDRGGKHEDFVKIQQAYKTLYEP